MPNMQKSKNLTKKFFKYLIPSISSMWVFSIYTMVDGMFIAKGVGPIALAAVNLSMPFINMIFGIALLTAIGSSTLISIYLGRGEGQKSNELFTLNIITLSFIGIFITLLSILFLEDLAKFLGANKDTLTYVKDYLNIIIMFSSFFMLSYFLEVLVKADGFPIFSILFVSLAAIINIGLDYLFIIVFDYGIKGAALATGISQFISFLGLLSHFLMGKSKLKFTRFAFDLKILKDISLIGFPDAITEFSAGITVYLFNFMILKYIGDDGIAAFSTIMYINNLVIMTMVGITQGMQPLVSFFYGRSDLQSIKKLLNLAFKSILVTSLIAIFICQYSTDALISLFINPSNSFIYKLSKKILKIFSYSFLLCGFNIVISGYFTALKENKKATLISILRGLLLISTFIFVVPQIYGEFGIWLSPIFNEIVTLCISLFIFSKSHTNLNSNFANAKN